MTIHASFLVEHYAENEVTDKAYDLIYSKPFRARVSAVSCSHCRLIICSRALDRYGSSADREELKNNQRGIKGERPYDIHATLPRSCLAKSCI